MLNINKKNLIFLVFGLLFVFSLLPISANAYYYVGWEGDRYVGYPINNGYYNNNNNLNPIPVITSISPNSTQVNTNNTITVTGYNFMQNSVVRWNNSERLTTFINTNTLRVQLDYYDSYNKGNYLISVFNPAPGGGYSNTTIFTVNSNIIPNTTSNNYTNSTTNKTTNTTNNVTTNDTTNESNNESNNSQVKDLAAGAIFGYNGFLPSSIFQWIFFFILILLAVILWRKLYVTDEERHTPLKHA